jgi:hypothetical protein
VGVETWWYFQTLIKIVISYFVHTMQLFIHPQN